MQRNLMTTINMFKNHPNKGTMKFVVIPVVREMMKFMNDVAMDINVLVQKFAPGNDICEGIHFDFSACFVFGIP